MHPCRYAYPVVLVHADPSTDPFVGVERRLAELGVRASRVLPDQPPPELVRGARVVVVTDWKTAMSRQILRQSRDLHLSVVLLVETDENPLTFAHKTSSALAALQRELHHLVIAATDQSVADALRGVGISSTCLPADTSAKAVALADLVHRLVQQPAPNQAADRHEPIIDIHPAESLLVRMRRAPRREAGSQPVVVNCVVVDDSPVGGVRTWAERLARGFADLDLPFHVRTLLIATRPEAWDEFRADLPLDDLTDVCLVDSSMDQASCLECVVESIRNVAGGTPALVLPNYSDITYAAASQLRGEGARTLAIAHTDDDYYRFLIREYPFDGVVGVSRACAEWLAPLAERIQAPCSTITYGVPVADAPRTPSLHGPIQLAYIGRMVQTQKRISDLLPLLDELERLEVPHVLHMIGDGGDLPAWRTAWTARAPRFGRVEFHGRKDPAWVERFLPSVDFSILVSEFEGTSITMLEGMGAGVIPAVTAVSSGVSEWVTDGVTGFTAPVGKPRELALRISEASKDRAALASIARSAWERVRGAISIPAMCRQYAEVFGQMLAAAHATPPAHRTSLAPNPNDTQTTSAPSLRSVPSDAALRLHEYWRWPREWCENKPQARHAIEEMMARAGFRRVAWNAPTPGCDVVVLDTERQEMTPRLFREIEGWRAEGIGVVSWPTLIALQPADVHHDRARRSADRLLEAAQAAVANGCRRIAIYGTGKHSRRVPAVFAEPFPFVGFMDDCPPPWEFMFGLPVVDASSVMDTLAPDAIILSSDAWEETLWARTRALRDRGVKVYSLYAQYAHPEASVSAA